MNILENLKLDRWFGIVLYFGVLLLASSIFGNVEFLNKKNIFGLGLGCICIGLSYFIAEKYLHQQYANGILSTKIIKHNFFSVLVLIIGILITLLFGYKIIKALLTI